MKRWSEFQQSRRIASLVSAMKREPSLPMLVLPSTPAAFAVVQSLCETMPVRVIGHPRLLSEWAPSLAAHVRSPLSLWREAKGHDVMPWVVASFPDQLVGDDASYSKLEVAGEPYVFSIIEMMLLMRFRPEAFMGHATAPTRRGAPSTLSLERFAGALPTALSGGQFETALGGLMARLVACRFADLPDWKARDFFSLKIGDNFKRMLALKLLEIEAVLRMGDIPSAEAGAHAFLLDGLKTGRKALLQGTDRAGTPQNPRQVVTSSCAAPPLPAALYSPLPRWLLAADRLRPVLGFHWPQMGISKPPEEIAERFDHYEVTALSHRLRTRRLHDDAFAVQRDGLDDYVAKRVIADVDALRGWMGAGTGAIFACPHYGPFLAGALLFASLGSEGNPSHVFYDPADVVPENQRFDELFKRFSGRLNVLHNEPRDLVKAARALRNRQCISIMFDVVQRATDSMFVPFCGRLYPAMGGAAFLSLQSGAPLVPSYVAPDEGGKARVVFGTPILPQDFTSADREQNVYDMTRALFRDFERQLRAAPWHWIYWENVVRAPRFDEGISGERASRLAEVQRRAVATPALLELAPVLGEFLRSREAGDGPRLACA
jgi:hypothetical protein